MKFFLNPKRRTLINFIKMPFIRIGLFLGFPNIDYSYVHGNKNIYLGKNCSTMNTIFNTSSGNIGIGDNTIFGHNCMVLTGVHRFYQGKRAKLVPNSEHYRETPEWGYNISIGKGCFIGSGAIIIAPVTIGDNVIIGAGSVVTRDIPNGHFAAGVPARIIKKV